MASPQVGHVDVGLVALGLAVILQARRVEVGLVVLGLLASQ